MASKTFRVHTRFREFAERCRQFRHRSRAFSLTAAGWLVSFYVTAVALETENSLAQLLLFCINGYFWIQLSSLIYRSFKPPLELLLAIGLLITWFEGETLSTAYGIIGLSESTFSATGILLFSLHVLLLAGMTLTLGLILLENSEGSVWVLVLYVAIAFFGIEVLSGDIGWMVLGMNLFLLYLLYRKTSWLEALSKNECWLYLITAGYLLLQFYDFSSFEESRNLELAAASLWYGLPYFYKTFISIYLAAIVLKIPIVLVYNHARLSRKLKISALFQSTLPQVSQLVMLLLVFYFFIAGWQAEKVREVLQATITAIRTDKPPQDVPYLIFTADELKQGFSLLDQGYQMDYDLLSDGGILVTGDPADKDRQQHFLFFKGGEEQEQVVFFIHFDNDVHRFVGNSLSPLAGHQLVGYRFLPAKWETAAHSLQFGRDQEFIHIFPFSILPRHTGRIQVANFRGLDWLRDPTLDIDISGDFRIAVGRVLIPIYTPEGAELGFYALDVSMQPAKAFENPSFMWFVAWLALVYLLINTLIIKQVVRFGSEINDMVVQKFGQLQDGIHEVASGNLDFKVQLDGQDEFVDLADHFNRMSGKLKEKMAEALEKDRLKYELGVARKVQLGLLPQSLPEIPNFTIASAFETATEVGGDFYDVIELGKGKFLFTIGDVSGKGTSAAFYMAQCLSLMRFAPQFTADPLEVAARLNTYFSDPSLDKQMFLTAVVGVVDSRTGQIALVRAGHEHPVIIPGDASKPLRAVKPPGIGIGLSANEAQFRNIMQVEKFKLAPGGILALYTDGVVEAQNPQVDETEEERFYGADRLLAQLRECQGKSATDCVNRITRDIQKFRGAGALADDYTLLLLRRDDADS